MKKNIKKINKSRKFLLQNLYGITLNKENNLYKIIEQKNKNKINEYYIKNTTKKLIEKNLILELIINTYKQNNKKIYILEKLILKIAIFEIFFNKLMPYKTIINEAIKLSKLFCSNKSHKIINKILDKIIKNN